ncbi:hypothetical protein O181_029417 [Austropuccinia psidii MF-1]|uniref:Uncharacterized protein n=1 Tax=Austropuccinia psidii MF-1 TaxID=1389203 RepID=A0A9Q3H3H8_9BASI|nr:hypothetical protein [Austropuccinia psidii MF-1]
MNPNTLWPYSNRKVTEKENEIKTNRSIEENKPTYNKSIDEYSEISRDRNDSSDGNSMLIKKDDRTTSHIKVVRPRHPTIINSDAEKLNILTYQGRIKAFITIQERSPKTYIKAPDSIHKEEW